MAVLMFWALDNGYYTSMSNFTNDVLELDRRVVNLEVMMQAGFHVAQNAFADRGRDVGDRDVAGERVSLRADAPDVQIVNVVDAVDRTDGGCDTFQLQTAWRAFEQDIQSLTHDAVSRPQDQRSDRKGKRGVDPVVSRHQDGPAAGDNRGSGESVSHCVEQSAANVDVTARAVKQQRDRAIHHHAQGGDPHHHRGLDVLRVLQTPEGLIKNEE